VCHFVIVLCFCKGNKKNNTTKLFLVDQPGLEPGTFSL
jgi:hypothetical protein